MPKAVTAADANRKFSQLLRGVRRGHSYIVTSHGQPVAKIAPVDEPGKVGIKARQALLARLNQQPTIEIGLWHRDELYEDEQ